MPIVVRVIVVLMLAAVSWSCDQSSIAPQRPAPFTYSVTGTAKTVQITYSQADYSIIGTDRSQTLPFVYTWPTPPNKFQLILLGAGVTTPGDSGTVRIAVIENGVETASDVATGYPNGVTIQYAHQ